MESQQKLYEVRVQIPDGYRVIGTRLTEDEKNLYVKLYRSSFPNLEVIELKIT